MLNRKDKTKTRFVKVIRLTVEDYEWIKANKSKKSLAGFLENIIKQNKNER